MITIHALAVIAAVMIMLYSKVAALRPLIFYFLASVLIGIGLAFIARQKNWHRRYLDYRVLAEGLRVQYYWSVAGVLREGQSKFAYDNFLRQRDIDLGWIRNVMRVAGTRVDAQPVWFNKESVKFVLDEWIGTEGGNGQLQYYKTKAMEKAKINRVTGTLARISLWAGIGIGVFLAFFLDDFGHVYESPLIILMGILPLIAGVAEAYTQRKADRELATQYEFMAQVFANARRRIDDTVTDS